MRRRSFVPGVSLVISSLFLNGSLHAQTPPPAGGVESVQKEHTVEAGDTLWDLSSRYLQNPWYWPKVWSYNPQITNPHFLYPGDKVRFFPGGEQQPARIAASSTREMPSEVAPAPASGEPVAAATELPPDAAGGIASAEGDAPPPPAEATDSGVSGRPGVTSDVSNRQMVVATYELLTKQELKEAGTLERSRDDKKMLSNYDMAYVRFTGEKPATNTRVVFYRTIREVEHPVTGDDVGYLTQVTGGGIVQEGGDGAFTAVQIDQTFDAIERGQLVTIEQEPLRKALQTTPNETKMKGAIITGEQYTKVLFGQFHYVFVDRGTRDGVKNGNSFIVVNDRDEYIEEEVPKFDVGKLVVVDAKETASLVLIVQSVRDLRAGDTIEMR